jgi:hypothetical protein
MDWAFPGNRAGYIRCCQDVARKSLELSGNYEEAQRHRDYHSLGKLPVLREITRTHLGMPGLLKENPQPISEVYW